MEHEEYRILNIGEIKKAGDEVLWFNTDRPWMVLSANDCVVGDEFSADDVSKGVVYRRRKESEPPPSFEVDMEMITTSPECPYIKVGETWVHYEDSEDLVEAIRKVAEYCRKAYS